MSVSAIEMKPLSLDQRAVKKSVGATLARYVYYLRYFLAEAALSN
jgi:hypothetical protein